MGGTTLALMTLAGAPSACGSPDQGPEAATFAHADGERGVGTFDTIWGVLTLDYEWTDGHMIHDGDIVLDPESEIPASGGEHAPGLGESSQPLLKAGAKWEMVNGIVKIPYKFDDDVGATRRKQIRDAMDEWESEIGFLQFQESATNAGRRVRFVKWSKSYCLVNGSNTAETIVYTSPECGWITYVHEIGHVLGFKHEQKRSDRNQHVVYDSSKTCATGEFSIFGDEDNHVGDYDSDSIMHYPSCMFAKTHSTCEGSSGCNSGTPGAWVLTRKPADGPAYIPWWEQRTKGNVIRSGDKCNFKSLYGVSCADPPVCIPKTCADAGKSCGVIDDDCGGTVSCGSCASPETCGGGGTPNVCGAPESSPFPAPSWFTGTMQSGGACVEVAGGSTGDGAQIRMASCSSTLVQQNWHMTPDRGWQNDKSGKCAEVAALSSGAGVTQQTCVGSEERQMWRVRDVEIVHGQTGRCMNVPYGDYHDGQNVIIMPCDGKAKQRFTYKPTTSEIAAGGWCLDAQASGGVVTGNDVKLRECDGTLSQQWNDARGGFVNRADPALCMRIEGGPDAPNGSNIEIVACNDSVGQMWGLRGALEHWHDEFCMTANGVGNQVTIATCNGAASQLFTKWSPP